MANEIEITLLRLSNKVAELEERVEKLEQTVKNQSVLVSKKIERPVRSSLSYPLSFDTNADIKNAMKLMAVQGILNENDVKNFTDAVWCSINLNLKFPFLRERSQGRNDESGYPRYWIDVIIINGNEYYVCSQWYGYNRKYFEKWFRNKAK